jgi:AcrR family transcriptional regulator
MVATERTTLTELRGKETKQRILDAAYLVFSRQGYGQATVDDVAREAGISKGALYHHFPGKEQLFHALLQDRVRSCRDHMLDAVGEIRSLPEAIRAAIETSFSSHHADPDWTPMFMEFWGQATRDEYARSIVSTAYSNCRETVAQILRAGQGLGFVRPGLDTDTVAVLYLAMVDGIRLRAQMDTTVDVDRTKELMADMIVGFIKSQPRDGGRVADNR